VINFYRELFCFAFAKLTCYGVNLSDHIACRRIFRLDFGLMRSFGRNASAEPDVVRRLSLSRFPYLRNPEHCGVRCARSVAGAPGIAMIMIVAAVVGLSLCSVRLQGFVIRDDLDATGIEITALADGRVEAHPAMCGDNVTAN
jgi:hypothetical protein